MQQTRLLTLWLSGIACVSGALVYHRSMDSRKPVVANSGSPSLAQEERRVETIAEQRHGILSLADEKVSAEAGIRPEIQEKAAEINAEYKKKSAEALQKALDEWRDSESAEGSGTPDFLQPSSDTRTAIGLLHTLAEKQVFDLLTPQEQMHWREMKPAQAEPTRFMKQRSVMRAK